MAQMIRVAAVRNKAQIVAVPARLARAMVQRGTHVYVDRAPKADREYERRDMRAEDDE